METPQTKFQTSFVPKKPVIASQANQYRKKSSFLLIVSLVIFVAIMIVAAGFYFYNEKLKNDIDQQRTDIKQANERFDTDAVGRANRLNDRIVAVKSILDNHISPSIIFDLLEDKTLISVRFKNFSFKIEPQNKIVINSTGVGSNLDAIVLQSDLFGDTGVLKDVVFSSVQPNEKGVVDFSFQAKIDPKYLLYSKALSTGGSLNNKDINTTKEPVNKTSTSTKSVAPKTSTTSAPAVNNQPKVEDNNFTI